MHAVTDAFGTIGTVATVLIQDGRSWAWHYGGDFWEPWRLVPILLWGGTVFVIAWTVARIFPKGRGDDERSEAPRDSAEEILRERFARGDISAEEYKRSLEVLRGESSPRTHRGSTPETGEEED
jgi:uncharacterized membrane protein